MVERFWMEAIRINYLLAVYNLFPALSCLFLAMGAICKVPTQWIVSVSLITEAVHLQLQSSAAFRGTRL